MAEIVFNKNGIPESETNMECSDDTADDTQASKKLRMEPSNADLPSETMPTLDCLNDDCLLLILTMLSFNCRLIAEQVSKRWQKLCRLSWKQSQVIVADAFLIRHNFEGPSPRGIMFFHPSIFHKLLIRSGAALKTLDINNSNSIISSHTIDTIAHHCKNIQHFIMPGIKLPAEYAEGVTFLIDLKMIISLQMTNCKHFNDDLLKSISNSCLKLERVNISCFSFITIEGVTNAGVAALANLPNLKELNIAGLDIGDDALLALSHARKLTKLDCNHCELVGDQGAIAILTCCLKLTEFVLRACKLVTLQTVEHAIHVMTSREENRLDLDLCSTPLRKNQFTTPLPVGLEILTDR